MGKSMVPKMAFAAVMSCVATLAVSANTIYVSAEYGDDDNDGSAAHPVKTIQVGVGKLKDPNPAYLIISNGVYKLDSTISFDGNTGGQQYCIVKSLSGNPADVVIDGQNSVRCIYHNGYSSQFLGITVANGHAADGKASGFCLQTGESFVVSNCVVRNCHSVSATGDVSGGGLYGAKRTRIYDTLVADCSAETTASSKSACGGGFMTGFSYDQSAEGTTIIRNVVVSNCAVRACAGSGDYGAYGGGAYLNRANVDGLVVIDCVASNTASSGNVGYGGGIFKRTFVTNTLENVFVTNCTASACGAGFYGNGYSPGVLRVRNCTFAGNTVRRIPSSGSGAGGGAYFSGVRHEVENSRFSGNRIVSTYSDSAGAGIYLTRASLLSGCVVEGNSIVGTDLSTAKGAGGGIRIYNCSDSVVSNCVVAANSANTCGAFYLEECDGALLTDIFCLSNNAANSYSIAKVSSTGNKKPVVIRNSHFTGNGGGAGDNPRYGAVYCNTQGADAPVRLEYCTFVSNIENKWYTVSPSAKGNCANVANVDATVSNLFVKGCVLSGGDTFAKVMGVVTNVSFTYVDGFPGDNIWTAELKNYNKSMMPGGVEPLVNLATDHRLKYGTPFINKGVREDWMGTGRKIGPMDMGDGSYSLALSGKYGVTILRNCAVPRVSGSAPDYGCFEYWFPRGGVISFR